MLLPAHFIACPVHHLPGVFKILGQVNFEVPIDNDTSPSDTPNLALIRTDLANERTLLAYIRTSLIVIGTGFSMIEFLTGRVWLIYLGWILIGAGIVIGLVGAIRFGRLQKRLHKDSKAN